MQTKKFVVLAVLFLLPITVYIFFASGKDNFVNLPTLSYGVSELTEFTPVSGDSVRLEKRITVLTFFGSDVNVKKANAFNLAHKIYKKNHQFSEFQFVTLITEDQRTAALQLKKKLAEIETPRNWRFLTGSTSAIEKVFKSLKLEYNLDNQSASDFVFIIDKERNLRGRNDDEDVGKLFGFDASDYAEINNKMSDDIKVLLAEYRLELKKYKADRKDAFRDRNLK
ncbi:MAG: hypothetical protein AAF489_09730 [Bacteroidota bacterium]